MPQQLSDQNFKHEISQGVVLVDFWAPWCGPCRVQGPIVEDVEKQFEGKAAVKVGKLNVDENPAIGQEFNILSIPTLIIFKQGAVAEHFIGLQSKQTLVNKIEKLINK